MNKGITTAILAVVILAMTNHGQSVEPLPQSRSRLPPTDSDDANDWFHAGPSWESLVSFTRDSFMTELESTAILTDSYKEHSHGAGIPCTAPCVHAATHKNSGFIDLVIRFN